MLRIVDLGLVVLLGTSTASVWSRCCSSVSRGPCTCGEGFGAARPPAPATGLTAVVASPVFGPLSTPELRLAWRRSCLVLVELPAGPARAQLVAVRQSILDELERRDATRSPGHRVTVARDARRAAVVLSRRGVSVQPGTATPVTVENG